MPTVADDTLAIDDGMRWMIDFDEAEARGMALRMTLTPTQVAAGIQSLIVFGVRGALPAADGAAQFAALLDAHHYTDGLEFLRFGAPTNNTAELRSAYSSVDTGEARSYGSEVGPGAAAAALPGSNARELGAALGLAAAAVPDVLGRIPGAGDSLKLDAASMNTALWPVTWGYYLSNLIGFDGTGLSIELLAWARRHYIDHVRGSGPLPAIRCGRQPYGLLPTTSLELWQPPPGEEVAHAPLTWLRTPLLRLRDNIWRGALREVPRLGSPADPHEALSQVMRTEALSSRYEMRSMLGRHYVQHLRAFIVEDLANNGWIPTQEAAASGILQRMNFDWRPRLHRSVYGDLSYRLRAPLVQAGEVSATRPLEPNYIAALLAETTIDDIAANHVQGADGGTLLHALLRHGLLLEYASAAAAILATTGTAMSVLLRDAELVDLVGGAPPTLTWRRQLDQRVSAVTGSRTIREHLQSADGLQSSAAAALREYRAALARLQGRDSETLQYLLQTTLDLASHRLDAWATSYATRAPGGDARGQADRARRRRLRLGGERARARLRHAGGSRRPTSRRRSLRRSTTPASSTRRRRRRPRRRRCCATRTWASTAWPRPTGRWRSTCRRAACAPRAGCSTACVAASRSARCSATASSAGCTTTTSTSRSRAFAASRRSWPTSSPPPSCRPKASPPATSSTGCASRSGGRSIATAATARASAPS